MKDSKSLARNSGKTPGETPGKQPESEPAQEIKVFISSRDSTCDGCKENLGRGAWIVLTGEKGVLCLACADLDHLIFLPPGNAALTRRARKASALSAVVLKWSSARKHYERQGLLVEAEALEEAERQCLADGDARARRQEREAERRAELDQRYVEEFARQARWLFPHCPPGRERVIAEHACQKYSGRIGRTATAKALDDEAIALAVVAHVRHAETGYDKLLAKGWDRREARDAVRDDVGQVMRQWKESSQEIS
jgi:hypothetical protein